MAWTQVVAVRFQEQCRELECWLNAGDEGQGGANKDAQPLAWRTRWLVVLFNKMEAQEEEGGENNEIYFWQAEFDLSWACTMDHSSL